MRDVVIRNTGAVQRLNIVFRYLVIHGKAPLLLLFHPEIREDVSHLFFQIVLKMGKFGLHIIMQMPDIFLTPFNPVFPLDHLSVFIYFCYIVPFRFQLRVHVEPFMDFFIFFSRSLNA
jgi:hypothetical protein